MAILIVILFFILIFASFFVVQFYNIAFRGFAPLISTRTTIVNKIIGELKLSRNDHVYELGCGKASFLHEVEKEFPNTKLIGVEYSFWPWMTSNVQLSLLGSKIKILKKNLFKINLSAAKLVYCYLNPQMMIDLEKKFINECKKGTIIISHKFVMPNLQPVKIITSEEDGKIYFYTI